MTPKYTAPTPTQVRPTTLRGLTVCLLTPLETVTIAARITT